MYSNDCVSIHPYPVSVLFIELKSSLHIQPIFIEKILILVSHSFHMNKHRWTLYISSFVISFINSQLKPIIKIAAIISSIIITSIPIHLYNIHL